MILHKNEKLFKEAVEFTAQEMNIPNIYIEKDYWVTYVLYTIFHDPIGKETIFKGGTSLSKCYGLIERFSEDIDLVVMRREDDSNNKLTNKIKKISSVVSKVLPEVQVDEITRKRGMNRKTAHSYSKRFDGEFGQIRDVIIVEAAWLGYHEPFTTKVVSSFIYDMMVRKEQKDLAKENNLIPFNVLVLESSRTLCEKIMSLVRFSYSENPIDNLKKKIRHTYDLHKLLEGDKLNNFFQSKTFDDMLIKVANDDVISFKNNNEWLRYHPNNSKMFLELESVWGQLVSTYNDEFKNLVFGTLPEEQSVYKTLQKIKKRLNNVEWSINLESQ